MICSFGHNAQQSSHVSCVLLPGWKLKSAAVATKMQKLQIFHAFLSATPSVASTGKQLSTCNSEPKT